MKNSNSNQLVQALTLPLIKLTHPNWNVYEDKQNAVPESINLLVKWFRYLCGSEKAVFLDEESIPEVCLVTFMPQNKSFSVLVLAPVQLDERLKQHSADEQLTLEESCLHVAAHEARHYFQHRISNLVLRNDHWWNTWTTQTFKEENWETLGKLLKSNIRLRKYAEKFCERSDTPTEVDAETTACACVASYRITQNSQTLKDIICSS